MTGNSQWVQRDHLIYSLPTITLNTTQTEPGVALDLFMLGPKSNPN